MCFSVLLGCGGGQSGVGQVALQVENARGPKGVNAAALTAGTASVSPVTVAKFQVTISGEGISPVIEASADAAADHIEILDIPGGVNRSILIEALNGEGIVIRRRLIEGVEITPGVVTPIQTSLLTIPIVTNLRNGSVVLAENFHVLGFGEPGSSVEVTAATSEQNISMSESIDGSIPTISPDLSTGVFDLTPSQRLIGRQTITLKDQENGEWSSIEIVVIPAGARPGRHIVSAGGRGISMGSAFGGARTVHFPKMIQTMEAMTK